MKPEAFDNYVARNCSTLSVFLAELAPWMRQELKAEMLDTCSPQSAAGRIDDLLSSEAPEVTRRVLQDKSTRAPLLATVAGSRFLYSVLLRDSDLLESLFLNRGCLLGRTLETKTNELRERTKDIQSEGDLNRVLRRYKDEEYLRIGCRDLSDLATVEEVMEELSDLAAACTRAALAFHWGKLVIKHGLPPGAQNRMGLVVLALGKLAGKELNFSSDVDLIFLRGPQEGRTSGPQSVSVAGFYEALSRAVSRTLGDVTEDGFVFRVDLRLRPEGEKGELCPSVGNALNYFLEWGRTWERAALMKAVPLAGDLELGKAFLRSLEPFLYRRHLDYSTIEEMREMKLQIAAQLRRKPGVNIKLGQGGIREIEFFVQAIQLINAGKIPAVRTSSTLKALSLLEESRVLDHERAGALRDAYLFFRRTEHRIQINHQRQTHVLPKTPDELEELARRMGYRENALRSFMVALETRRQVVGDLFSTLFYSLNEDIISQCSKAVKSLVEHIHDEDRTCHILESLEFPDPKGSYPTLKGLLAPSDCWAFSAKSCGLLERLAPLLVDELLKVPEPAKTLVDLDRYVGSLQGRSAYLSTLLENPPTARFLVKILGESRFFAELLIRHPQAIDSLIGRFTAQHPREKETLAHELSQRIAYCDEYEAELDVLRIFKNEQILRIGVSHLAQEIDSTTARWLVSELAEVCLGGAVEIAAKEMDRRFGPVDQSDALPFVILGMGKLGGREMSYLSDVDVIFIYEPVSEKIGPFSSHEWFTRLANRLMSILSVHTSEGMCFEIDTRLRPSGQKGPLVSSLASFREYHESTSKLWEKQALIKARPVTGPVRLLNEVAHITRECVLRTVMSDQDIKEINRLRKRMQTELALEDKDHVDVKTGHGGLVDVEFLVQANILIHGKDHPEVLNHNTLESLAALHQAGLLKRDTFRTLDSGYRFLSDLEDRLRIMEHRSVNRIPLEGDKLRGLAMRLGYDEANQAQLLEDYFRITDSIRNIYNSFFGDNGPKG